MAAFLVAAAPAKAIGATFVTTLLLLNAKLGATIEPQVPLTLSSLEYVIDVESNMTSRHDSTSPTETDPPKPQGPVPFPAL